MNQDWGIYIHFPFCLSKCPYCAFNSVTFSKSSAQEYLTALKREVEARLPTAAETRARPSSIYFGGGTPSLMPAQWAERLLAGIAADPGYDPEAEVSLEVNPDVPSPAEKLFPAFRQAGFNRAIIGVQSFQPTQLNSLGRRHSPDQAFQAYQLARAAGFTNLGIDLIFGLPGQSLEDWTRDLETAVSLGPDHISTYSLTLEKDTPFYRLNQVAELTLPDEQLYGLMFKTCHYYLSQHGYEHYEVSNYARPGYRSVHNQLYWRRQAYLGLGAGAHSFFPEQGAYGVREASPTQVSKYMGQLNQPAKARGREYLSRGEALCEALFFGIRTIEGVDMEELAREFQLDSLPNCLALIEELEQADLVTFSANQLVPTWKGMLVADEITLRLLKTLS